MSMNESEITTNESTINEVESSTAVESNETIETVVSVTEETPIQEIAETVIVQESISQEPIPQEPLENESVTVAPVETATIATPEVAKIEDKDFSTMVNSATVSEEKLETKQELYKVEAENPKVKNPNLPNYDKLDDIFDELNAVKSSNGSIEVLLSERITGGFRAIYKDAPLFLPSSHFSNVKKTEDEELKAAVGTTIKVQILDLKDADGKKSVVVTRKNLIASETLDSINVGDKVSGVVSSVPSFGVFLRVGGVEGLIHVSRLSHAHIDKPSDLYKVGDKLEAIVLEIDKANNKLALSRKELEKSPWDGIAEKYIIGSKINGTVRRFTDFGAYVELEPSIDGLVRISEISWTKRIKHPSQILKAGQAYDFQVVSIQEDKKAIGLSYKRAFESPWADLLARYPQGFETKGVISQFMDKGALVTINDEVDAFMPKSKMRPFMSGNKMAVNIGDEIEIRIADIVPENESMIVVPILSDDQMEEMENARPSRDNNRDGGGRDKGGRNFERREPSVKIDASVDANSNSNFSLGDMLSSLSIEKLNKNS
jgi:predicted RNA-binding protein with RPS1 domain